MPTHTTTTKIPNPLYAAAGAGDLAYEQIRKLPEKVAELRGRAAELRPAVTGAVAEVNLRADLDKLRDAARRNAVAFVTGAQERAVAVYDDLVFRGQKVVGNVRTAEVDVEVSPAAGVVVAQVSTEPEKPSNRAANRTAIKEPAKAAAKPLVKKAPAKRA